MATAIDIVSQHCMDSFYQNYRASSDFFDLEDFIFHAGATLGDYYRQEFKQKYDEIRQEKSDEIVTFTSDILVDETVKVKNNSALLEGKIMSFAFDRQNSGIQDVLASKPSDCIQLERTNLAQIWQLRYTPATDVVFWYYDRGAIKFYNKGTFNIQEIVVLYVPAVSDKMLCPDSLIDWVVNNTVQKMKGMKQGTIVKKSLDGQQNYTLETEMDKSQLK